MSRRPKPRQPANNGHDTARNGSKQDPPLERSSGTNVDGEEISLPGLRIITSPPGRLTLSRLDWVSAILLAIAMLLAPVWAATFANPPSTQSFSGGLGAAGIDPGLVMSIWAGPVVSALIAAAFCVMAVRERKRPVAIGAVPGMAGAFGFLAIWASLSTINNPAVYISLNALTLLFACILAAAMISRLARDRNALVFFLLTIVAAGSITAGIGVNEYLQYWKMHDPTHRTFATFLNPDFLAGYLLLPLPLTLAAFLALDHRLVRLCTGVALALQTACLLLTASRSGIAVGAVSIFVFIGLAHWMRTLWPRWKMVGLALLIAAATAALSAAPTRSRFNPADHTDKHTVAAVTQEQSGDSQAHSAAFRKWTWIGTARIALRNPILGTGIGTFDQAYPRYAQTAYTSHAHNTFLQWTAETGFPGILLLLTGLAALTAFVTNIMLLTRGQVQKREPSDDPGAETVAQDQETLGTADQESRLLLAGLSAALAGSVLHSLFDSDWYLTATLLTLCAVLGLVTAQARALAPLAAKTPKILGREFTAVGLLVCAFVLWRSGQTGLSRWEQAQITRSTAGVQALAHARSAAAADPFDPEPHLLLAQLLANSPEAVTELKNAVRLAPGGKTYYLLGKFYLNRGQTEPAIEALDHARELEPNNLQTLRLLADTEVDAGRHEQARETYEAITILETAPYGTVRAMPEYVETEFAFAHARLGDMAFAEKKMPTADREYARADAVLRRYWLARHWGVNEARAPEKRRAVFDLYIHVLDQWHQTLQQENKPADAEAVLKEQADVEAEAAADQKAEEKEAQQI